MKKVITLSLVIAMLALSGCGKVNNTTTDSNAESNVTSEAEASGNYTEEQAEAKLDGVTTEKIEQMADEIQAAKDAGDKEKEQQLLAEMQEYLEAIEALTPETQE